MEASASGLGRVSAANNHGAAATANVRPSTSANEGEMGHLLKQLRETYECPICYGCILVAGYGKICSSGHRICSMCKDEVVETVQPDGTTTTGPMDKCPLCRTYNLRDDNMVDEHFHYEQVAKMVPFKCKEGNLGEGCG
jgi:rubrerythrin